MNRIRIGARRAGGLSEGEGGAGVRRGVCAGARAGGRSAARGDGERRPWSRERRRRRERHASRDECAGTRQTSHLCGWTAPTGASPWIGAREASFTGPNHPLLAGARPHWYAPQTDRPPNVRDAHQQRMSALTPFTDLQDIAKAVTHRQASPVELVREILDAIGRHNPSLNAYITVTGAAALEAAERVEKLVAAKKDPGPLAGVPIAIKDLILTSDAPTTAGSQVFGDGIPAGDEATVVKRLRKAGAIILGKTNLHEVALGVTSANEHFGPARNPWNAEHVAGGSSGGSASAVAAGLCAAVDRDRHARVDPHPGGVLRGDGVQADLRAPA